MCAVLLVAGPGILLAQHPQERNGFWIGFGFGYGSLGVDDCDECGRDGGLAGNFRLGGKLSDKVLLGFESNAWIDEDFGTTVTAGTGTATVYFYPSPTGGLHFKGGLGLAHLDIEDAGEDTGEGLLLGAAYDIRVGRNTSVVPSIGFYAGDFDGGSINILVFGVGVTFH